MKCLVCGEKYNMMEGMAVFQKPHSSAEKPVHVFMCRFCGLIVEKFVNDLKKDFCMIHEPLPRKKK